MQNASFDLHATAYLTLHERLLQGRPPLLQRAAQAVPVVVHVLQFGLKLTRLGRVRPYKLAAAQVDGQDDGLALVVRLLQLLQDRHVVSPQAPPWKCLKCAEPTGDTLSFLMRCCMVWMSVQRSSLRCCSSSSSVSPSQVQRLFRSEFSCCHCCWFCLERISLLRS